MEKYELIIVLKMVIPALMFLSIHDKINEKKFTPSTLITIFLAFLIWVIPLERENISKIFMIPQIWIGILVIVYQVFLKIYIKSRNKYYEIKENDNNNLKQNTIWEYNPSIVGYLINHKIELKDLSADILKLYADKILEIKKDTNNKYQIIIGEKYQKNKEILKSSDKYIIEYIRNKSTEFNFKEWKNRVKNEYAQLGFSKKREYDINKLLIISAIIIVGGTFIFKSTFDFGVISALFSAMAIEMIFLVIVYIEYINMTNKNILLTHTGKEKLREFMKFKEYIEDYTLLEEKTVEEICTYEKYIPYAVALGVNKKYKDAISDIFGEEFLKIIEDMTIIEYYDGDE